MSLILLAVIGGGNCYIAPQLQVRSYAVQQYAAPVVYPIYVAADNGGAASRLRATEEAILKLTQVVEQQQLLIQAGGVNGGLLQQTSKYEAAARRVIQTNCLSCHNPNKTEGGLDLTQPLDIGQKLLVAELAASGEMPPNGKELEAEDAQTLLNWSREDREAVREYLRGGRKESRSEAPRRPNEAPSVPPDPKPDMPEAKEDEERLLLRRD